MNYFISGHRDLTQQEFDIYYKPKIDQVLTSDKNATFLVGTSQGCDCMAIKYLDEKQAWFKIFPYEKEYYKPKNGTGYVSKIIFTSYDERDKYMTLHSNFDIAWIRKGKESSCTAMNILRRFQ